MLKLKGQTRTRACQRPMIRVSHESFTKKVKDFEPLKTLNH